MTSRERLQIAVHNAFPDDERIEFRQRRWVMVESTGRVRILGKNIKEAIAFCAGVGAILELPAWKCAGAGCPPNAGPSSDKPSLCTGCRATELWAREG